MRLLRCNNAPRFLRSVRGIRDVFMSKREREGDLEPSSVPSPCLLSTDPRETGCFPSEFLSLLLSSNAFESIQRLYAFVVLQSWTRSLLFARTIDDLRNLKKEDTRGFYLIFLLDEIYWKRASNFLDLIFQNCVRNAVSFPRNSPRIIRGPGILRLWKGIKISVTHCKVSVRSVKETRR